jgi:hypothetical protein
MVICFDLKKVSQKMWPPRVHHMDNDHHLFFIHRSAQIIATQFLASKGQRLTILCENCSNTNG